MGMFKKERGRHPHTQTKKPAHIKEGCSGRWCSSPVTVNETLSVSVTIVCLLGVRLVPPPPHSWACFSKCDCVAVPISLFCAYSTPLSSVLLPVTRKSISPRHAEECLNSPNASEGQRSKERGGSPEEL